MKKKNQGPKVLYVDIENMAIKAWVWGLFDQNIGLNQIIEDSFIIAWAAKWADEKKVMYMDQRNVKNPNKDSKKLLQGIHSLLDKADIVIGQNSKRFDVKKLNTAFLKIGLKKPSGFKQTDTLEISRRNFAHTSNKLEFVSEKYNNKYKKLKHEKYPGFTLWTECIAGNQDAWKDMEKYNSHDVLATQEYHELVRSWDNSNHDPNLYHDDYHHVCRCGSYNLKRNGYSYTSTGKYIRYKCKSCGAESRDSKNLLTKEKRDSLKRKA